MPSVLIEVLLTMKVCKIVSEPDANVFLDNEQRVPYLVKKNLWISFDDVNSTKEKVSAYMLLPKKTNHFLRILRFHSPSISPHSSKSPLGGSALPPKQPTKLSEICVIYLP